MNNIAIVIIFWFGVAAFVALMTKLYVSFEQQLFFINVNKNDYYTLLKILKEYQVPIADVSYYVYYKIAFKATTKKYNQIIYRLMDEQITLH